MTPLPDEDSMNVLFKAEYTCKVLRDYADHFVLLARSLRDCIMLNTHSDIEEKSDDGCWSLSCNNPDSGSNGRVLLTLLLMMAVR